MIIETAKASIFLEEEFIIKILLKDDTQLQSDDMRAINEAKKKLVGETMHAVLMVAGNGSTISKELLEKMNIEKIPKNQIAKAIVVNGIAQPYISNFFKLNNKNKRMIMAFKSEKEAISWLKFVN